MASYLNWLASVPMSFTKPSYINNGWKKKTNLEINNVMCDKSIPSVPMSFTNEHMNGILNFIGENMGLKMLIPGTQFNNKSPFLTQIFICSKIQIVFYKTQCFKKGGPKTLV